jgi:hypothetical protein
MATHYFDITLKCIDFAYNSIKEMAGNAGQETLIERLKDDANGQVFAVVTVDLDAGTHLAPDVTTSGDIYWKSSHPEAIEIIIEEAKQNVELLKDQATILGPWSFLSALSTGNWKIVGYDQGWL